MTEDNSPKEENEICIHIFSVSAGMVGVCVTVIGIFRAAAELKSFTTVGDNILAFDALVFLASCFSSYLALRSKSAVRKRKIEKTADWLFLIGLSLIAVVCVIIAYTFV